MAARDKQRETLQMIFSFFLGLMVVAFVGVGVNTFYPEPGSEPNDKLQKLYEEQNKLDMGRDKTSGQLSPADELRYKALTEEIGAEQTKVDKVRNSWARNTSIVLIAFATLIMGISLIRSDQLKLISNGLLLGGLFTMVYGTGWSFAGNDSKARFAVVTVALVATLALGYMKFVRGREDAEDQPPAQPPAPAE
jgi:hypothetical protein